MALATLLVLPKRVMGRWPSRLIPAAVGSLLLAAAGLKVAGPPLSFFQSPFISLALIDLEVLVGIWLWSGLWSIPARLVAIGLFSGFAASNVGQAASGVSSCACFGPIGLGPWSTLAIDLATIICLLMWRPVQVPECGGARLGVTVLASILSLVGLSAAVPQEDSNEPKALLVASPEKLDLGIVGRGHAVQARFVLHNPGCLPVAIGRVETSCPCLKAVVYDVILQPGKITTGEIVFDLGRVPRFAGNLEMIVMGYSVSGERAFLLGVTVGVN